MSIRENGDTYEIDKESFQKILLYLYMYNTECRAKKAISKEIKELDSLLEEIKISIR